MTEDPKLELRFGSKAQRLQFMIDHGLLPVDGMDADDLEDAAPQVVSMPVVDTSGLDDE